jgi:hypothetical protein
MVLRRRRAIILPAILIACSSLLAAQPTGAQQTQRDPWEPVRILAGDWVGSAEGQAGAGTVRRTYTFILKDAYLHEKNVSAYPPQKANPSGEIHEHWSLMSYDRERRTLVLRQFHQEGFVNQYVLTAVAGAPAKIVFESERFENVDNGWKARETYEIVSVDEFIETFELGAPGKELQVYSRNHFTRFKGRHCADNKKLTELTKEYGILVLCAAASFVAGADSICVAAFDTDWKTFRPDDLARQTPRDTIDAALERVCATVLSLPTGKDTEVMLSLEVWCAVYRLIGSYSGRGAEAFATAVAFVPAVADLLPRDIARRAPRKEDVGESLASAEHTMLYYALADCLAGMADEQRTATLLALSEETTKAAREER